MAVQPIDLQTLFTQVDKVGRAQMAQREGLAVQQMMQGVKLQRKTDEEAQSVNQAQDMGDGTQKINDKGNRQDGGGKKKKNQGVSPDEDENEDEEKPETLVFRDPLLGRNVDISY